MMLRHPEPFSSPTPVTLALDASCYAQRQKKIAVATSNYMF